MSVYRVAAERELEPASEASAARGLVRANGARCTCTPPGRLWCWWFHVMPADRWHCAHGGGWRRMYDRLEGFYWAEIVASADDER